MDTFKFSQVVPGTQWSGSKPSQESYVVDKCVFGSGDFSRVYIVTSTRSKKKYAMKMMKRSEDNISEASILLGLNEPRLRHPNHICRLYDIIAMEEYCNYGMIIEKGACSVFDSMHGPLHERHVKRIINQLLLALDTLHAIGIVHADVKPENVLYRPSTRFFAKTIHGKNHFELLNPVIMLCDFNCSKYMPNFGSYAVEVFQTFHYRAPEVTLGQNLSASIDIFSTGAMMVEMLTGEVVFDMDEKDERDPSVPLRKKHMLLLEAEMGDCPQETLAASRFPEFHGALWRADAPRIHDGQSVYREWRRTKEENRNPSDRQLLAVLDSMLTWPTRRVAAEALTRMAYFRQMVVDHPRSHYYAGFEEIDPVQLLTDPVLPEHHPISEGEDGIYQTEEEGGRMVELQQQYQGDSQSEDSQIEVAD